MKGGVVRAGYIASFILPEGISCMDAVGGEMPPWCEVNVRLLMGRVSHRLLM
jgi:hypothetical protein